MKRLFKPVLHILRPILLFILLGFFDRKYLTGKHFEVGFAGYLWAARSIWQRSILRLAPPLPFPAGLGCSISKAQNLKFHSDDLNNFQTNGTYFQNFAAEIVLGRGCYIAPNVGLITANHDPADVSKHLPGANITIGEKCWIGMNCVILSGVSLGPNTIVGAGSVVTKSFPEGHCIIAGSPARHIRSTHANSEKKDT